jgi:hypothetical protein
MAVVAAQLAFAAPVVRGEGACPSAAEVARRLNPLLPATSGDGGADSYLARFPDRPFARQARDRLKALGAAP